MCVYSSSLSPPSPAWQINRKVLLLKAPCCERQGSRPLQAEDATDRAGRQVLRGHEGILRQDGWSHCGYCPRCRGQLRGGRAWPRRPAAGLGGGSLGRTHPLALRGGKASVQTPNLFRFRKAHCGNHASKWDSAALQEIRCISGRKLKGRKSAPVLQQRHACFPARGREAGH